MFLTYISGVVAGLTPCTVSLIPIFLYRFGIWSGEKKQKAQILNISLFITGFLINMTLIGLGIQYLTQSNFANILKLILGSIFIILGILQLTQSLSLNFVKKVINPFLLGLIMPLSISLSPCVLPIFSTILSSGITSQKAFIKLISFSLGLISPGILSALIGNIFLKTIRNISGILEKFENYLGIILIFSGIYMNFQTLHITKLDIILGGIFWITVSILGFYSLFNKKISKIYKIGNILIITAYLILGYLFLSNCYKLSDNSTEINKFQCHHQEECEVCRKCGWLFSIAALSATSGYIIKKKGVKFKIKKS